MSPPPPKTEDVQVAQSQVFQEVGPRGWGGPFSTRGMSRQGSGLLPAIEEALETHERAFLAPAASAAVHCVPMGKPRSRAGGGSPCHTARRQRAGFAPAAWPGVCALNHRPACCPQGAQALPGSQSGLGSKCHPGSAEKEPVRILTPQVWVQGATQPESLQGRGDTEMQHMLERQCHCKPCGKTVA